MHVVEGGGGLPHFDGAFGADGRGFAAAPEGFGGGGEAFDAAHLAVHEQHRDATEHDGGADEEDHEQVDRQGEQPIARHFDPQDLVGKPDLHNHRIGVVAPADMERAADALAQGGVQAALFDPQQKAAAVRL